MPWLRPEERRLAMLAAGVRLAVLLATTALDVLLPDYDTSKFITPAAVSAAKFAGAYNSTATATASIAAASAGANAASSLRGAAATTVAGLAASLPPWWSLRGWLVWDAVFFSDIAARGYVFEQYFAFFPLMPALLSRAPSALFAPMALTFSAAASVACTVMLHRLGVSLTRDQRLSALACLFFIFNPTTVFHAAPYTESAFTAATLAALVCLYCGSGSGWRGGVGDGDGDGDGSSSGDSSVRGAGRLLSAVAAVAVSCGLRSNGVINAGYLGHHCLSRAVAAWPFNKIRAVRLALTGVCAAVLSVTPLVLFQFSAYDIFCRRTRSVTSAVGSHSAAAEGVAAACGMYCFPRPWCSSRVPYAYGFVQSLYWNVGFLRYWTLQQLPNFLLAAPVLLLSVAGLLEYCRANARRMAALGLAPLPPLPPRTRQANGTEGEIGVLEKEAAEVEEAKEGTVQNGGLSDSPAWGDKSADGSAGQLRHRTAHPQLPQASGDRIRPGDGSGSGTGRRVDGVSRSQGEARRVGGAGGACSNSSGSGFLRPELTVLMYPWAFSLAVALTAMHVQVATRFLLSSCPPLYWYMAHLWLRAEAAVAGTAEAEVRRRREDGGGNDGGGDDGGGGGVSTGGRRGGGKENDSRGSEDGGGGVQGGGWWAWLAVALWRWCFVYMGLGCALFINFLPWT